MKRRSVHTTRRLLAIALAGGLHFAFFGYVQWQPVRTRELPVTHDAITLVAWQPPPPTVPVVPETPEAQPAPTRAATDEQPPKARAPTTPATPATPATTDPPVAAATAAATPPVALPNSGVSLRVAPPDAIGQVLGATTAFGASASVLEGALDDRAEGPLSDGVRAKKRALAMIQAELASDEVTAGLVDDYFRVLKGHVLVQWRPKKADLNDGGKRISQVGMTRGVFEEPEGWQEMWSAYLDMASQYANGQKPTLKSSQQERLRELMRSRKGPFRYHAIVEAKLTQAADGKVLTIELQTSSGHDAIDEGVRDAIAEAVKALPEAPPQRVHGGRSFVSTWRLRATWIMVPPTALLTGAGFDITPQGFQVDVPFDVQLKTNVMLLSTETHGKSSLGDVGGDGE